MSDMKKINIGEKRKSIDELTKSDKKIFLVTQQQGGLDNKVLISKSFIVIFPSTPVTNLVAEFLSVT